MQRVMKIVVPLRVHTVAARLERGDHARPIEVAFRDHDQMAPTSASSSLYLRRELLEKVNRGSVENA